MENISINLEADKLYNVHIVGVNCTPDKSDIQVIAGQSINVVLTPADSSYNGFATLAGNIIVTKSGTGDFNGSDPYWDDDNVAMVDFNDFDGAGDVTYTITLKPIYYGILATVLHATADAGNPTQLNAGATGTFTYTAESGYRLPDSVTVTNAQSYVWTKETGVLSVVAKKEW